MGSICDNVLLSAFAVVADWPTSSAVAPGSHSETSVAQNDDFVFQHMGRSPSHMDRAKELCTHRIFCICAAVGRGMNLKTRCYQNVSRAKSSNNKSASFTQNQTKCALIQVLRLHNTVQRL